MLQMIILKDFEELICRAVRKFEPHRGGQDTGVGGSALVRQT